MKILVNVSPNFYRFAPHILRRLSTLEPDTRVSAVVQGGYPVYPEFVQRVGDLATDRLLDFSKLEKEWLAKPYKPGRLREYEALLGENAVNRIVQADRMVGWGFVRGGVIPKTPLADICQSDEMRHRYVLGLLDFLFDWFRKDPPDIVFTYAVAGALTFSLSLVAQHFGVPYRRLHEIRLGNRCILDSSIINMADPLKDLFQRACRDESVVADTREEARQLLTRMREEPALPDYHVLMRKSVLKLPPWKHFAAMLWRTLRRREPDSLDQPYYMTRFWWEIARYIKAHRLVMAGPFEDWAPLRKQNFVYYPLHVDPEATTMVLAPHAANQLMVIEALAKAIPAEWLLVVKDHYTMLGRRPAGFYDRLKAMPKVRLVSPTVSTFEVTQASRLVAVITGTAGWEAMQMGKPVLCMGPAHYQNVGEGFVLETNFTKLAEAVERALATPPATDRVLELYIAAMLKGSFPLPAPILNDVGVTDEFLEAQTVTINAIADGLVAASKQPGRTAAE